MAEKKKNNSDLYHLELLSIFHYILGIAEFIVGFISMIYLVRGIIILMIPETHGEDEEFVTVFGGIYIFLCFGFTLLIWALATMLLMTGYKLSRCKSYLFCLIIACIECIFVSLLGIFTLFVLLRPGVKELFNLPAAKPSGNPLVN